MVGPHVRVLSLEGELPVDLVFGSASGNPIRRQEYRPQEFLFLWTYGEVRRRKKKKNIDRPKNGELADEVADEAWKGGKMEALFGTCIIKRRALSPRFDYRCRRPSQRGKWQEKKEKKERKNSKKKETLQKNNEK